MRLMPIARVPDGAILGCDLWTGRNSSIPLLRAGTRMTPRYRDALVSAGLRAVHIDDELSRGIEIRQPVREEVRRQAAQTVDRTLSDIRTAVDGGQVVAPQLAGHLSSLATLLAQEIDASGETVGLAFDDLASADAYTFQHCVDVATLGMVLAHRTFRRYGWIDARGKRRFDQIEQRLSRIGLGLLLHDIGKITIPTEILNKPSKLDDEEWEIVKGHPVAGVELLADAALSPLVSVVVRSHHERWDGRGYPNGLAGDRINELARIAAVADVFDAITSERPYKPAKPASIGVQVITEGCGTAFDPEYVDIFLKTVAPYPPGTEVVLSDGARAIVVSTPDNQLDRPVVRILPSEDDPEASPVEVALLEHPTLLIADAPTRELVQAA